MKKMNSFKMVATSTSVAVLVLAGQAALADGPYYGVGLAVYSSTSEPAPDAGFESEDVYGAIGGTVGYRWDGGASFGGVEADLDIPFGSDFEYDGTPCSTAAAAPYYCEHNATLRLRGVFGRAMGAFEGFASFGMAVMQGEGADSETTTSRGVNTGYTVGLGLQSDAGAGKVRYEIVYDNLENVSTNPDGGDPTFESVSLKVSYLFN